VDKEEWLTRDWLLAERRWRTAAGWELHERLRRDHRARHPWRGLFGAFLESTFSFVVGLLFLAFAVGVVWAFAMLVAHH
jgi:hypothetical protein